MLTGWEQLQIWVKENPAITLIVATISAIIALIMALYNIILQHIIKWLSTKFTNWRLRNDTNAQSYAEEDIKDATKYYIRPTVSHLDPAEEDEIKNCVPVNKALFQVVDDFFSNKDQKYLFLLADSGMGKTSFVLSYFAYNKSRWYSRKSHKLGIVYLGSPDAEKQIHAFQNKSKTKLLIDAFDEDSQASEDWEKRLTELFKLTSEFSHVIFTSRSQFFPKDPALPQTIGTIRFRATGLHNKNEVILSKLFLEPFDEKQIEAYLKKRFYGFWNYKLRKKLREIIIKIPYLVVRPMILAYIPYLIDDHSNVNDIYDIYERLVEKWYERESKWLNSDDLKKFSENLAVDIFLKRDERKSETIQRSELSEKAKKYNINLEEWKLASRSLLNRNAKGDYKFSHRSIMEFLFIKKFIESNDNCKVGPWTDMMKQFYIVYLLKRCRIIPKILKEPHNDLGVENKIKPVTFADLSDFSNENFKISKNSNILVEYLSFEKLYVENSDFVSLVIFKLWLNESEVLGSSFKDSRIEYSKIIKSSLTKIKLIGETIWFHSEFILSRFETSLQQSVFHGTFFSKSTITIDSAELVIFHDCIFEDCNIIFNFPLNKTRKIVIMNCMITGGNIYFPAVFGDNAQLILSECKFDQTELSETDPERTFIVRCDFYNTDLGKDYFNFGKAPEPLRFLDTLSPEIIYESFGIKFKLPKSCIQR